MINVRRTLLRGPLHDHPIARLLEHYSVSCCIYRFYLLVFHMTLRCIYQHLT